MNFSKREKFIFIVTVAVIILSLTYNFIIEPIFKKWSSINNEIIIKRIAIKKGLRLLEDKNAILNNYNTYVGTVRDASRILSYIENKANILGVKTANIRPRPVVQKEFYKEYVIELQVEGTFSAINKFISELIKSPVFITVERFDLRTITETSSYLKGTLILSKPLI